MSSGPGLNRHFVTFCIYGISDFSVGAALYYNCIYVYANFCNFAFIGVVHIFIVCDFHISIYFYL